MGWPRAVWRLGSAGRMRTTRYPPFILRSFAHRRVSLCPIAAENCSDCCTYGRIRLPRFQCFDVAIPRLPLLHSISMHNPSGYMQVQDGHVEGWTLGNPTDCKVLCPSSRCCCLIERRNLHLALPAYSGI